MEDNKDKEAKTKPEDLQGKEFGDRTKRSKAVLNQRYSEFKKWLKNNSVTKDTDQNG